VIPTLMVLGVSAGYLIAVCLTLRAMGFIDQVRHRIRSRRESWGELDRLD
jgi:hypothetical protein